MNQQYVVRPNRWRGSLEGIIYSLMAIGIIFVAIVESMPFIFRIVLIFLSVLLFVFAQSVLRQAWSGKTLYTIDENGVTDYTQSPSIKLLWCDIVKIEMIPNNSSLQIGILAKDVTATTDITERVKNNVKNNGNFAIYTIMIDGFKFSGKQFNEIFKQLKLFGGEANPSILIDEYIDPVARRKLREQREAQYIRSHPSKFRKLLISIKQMVHLR